MNPKEPQNRFLRDPKGKAVNISWKTKIRVVQHLIESLNFWHRVKIKLAYTQVKSAPPTLLFCVLQFLVPNV